jgi:hypothetical protein
MSVQFFSGSLYGELLSDLDPFFHRAQIKLSVRQPLCIPFAKLNGQITNP